MPRKKQGDVFIPVDERDIKHALEVPVKQVDPSSLMTIEKPGRKKRIKKELKPLLNAEGKVGKIIKRPGDYILIITEKPAAAAKIADALGNARKISEGGVSHYELTRNNKKLVVACAVGHLFTIVQKEKSGKWPVFDLEWRPNFQAKKNDWSKKYYTTLTKLCKDAESFIVATDYDIEGEVIGWNIIRFIAKVKDAERMKFSSLTKPELEEAYEKRRKTIDWGQAIAGETRHYLDWMYGINLSRALMSAIKKAGSFRIMSIGRVQGPALNIVVERELEIKNFKSEPYWQVFLIVNDGRNKVEVKYIKDLTKKSELIPFKNLKGKKTLATTEKNEQHLPPPAPFDLTTLQTEIYRFFRISPARTLQIAQQLYLQGIISYPRTSSQKIPEAIQPKKILDRLAKTFSFIKENAKRAIPIEGKKSDPAHPSIYPTGEFADVEGDNKKVYELIVRRFVSCFCNDAVIDRKQITITYEDLKFTASGAQIKEEGWMKVYKSSLKEKELPDVQGEVLIEESRIEEKMTQPPKRYTPASLVAELTKRNLGTKATRAAIVETLYQRGYIKEQSIEATSLGIQITSTLKRYSPIIIDEKLTRYFEKEMDLLQTIKTSLSEKEEQVIQEAKRHIQDIAKEFQIKEMDIGKELISANTELRKAEQEANTLNQCPNCKKGSLRIMYSPKIRRSFIGCSSYPECKTIYSLPPNALIKPSQKACPECTFQRVLAIRKAKRPWEFCFNPQCPTRQVGYVAPKNQEGNQEQKEEIQINEKPLNDAPSDAASVDPMDEEPSEKE